MGNEYPERPSRMGGRAMSREIKACPFCGGDDVIRRGMSAFIDVEIGCDVCSFSGPNFGSMDETFTPELDAALHWNTRHTPNLPTKPHMLP